MKTTKFYRDLENGKRFEKIAVDYINCDNVKHIEGNFKYYDFIAFKNGEELRCEVKSDRLASNTGNLCIEFECWGNPSGIATTKADVWVYFVVHSDTDYECYVIPRKQLKKLCKDCRCVRGGDNYASRMFLLPKICCKEYLITQDNKYNFIKNNQTA